MSIVDMITIIVSSFSFVLSVITFISSIIHDRKKDTLDAYNTLQEQALDRLSLFSVRQMKEIAEERRSEQYKEVSHYLARVQHFAVGVRRNVYNKEIVYELSKGFLNGSIADRLRPLIEAKNRIGERNFYEDYLWLIDWMDRKSR